MIGYIRKLFLAFFGKPADRASEEPPPPPPREKSAEGAHLTGWERYYITESRGTCPDCEVAKLLFGPRGGLCRNMLCQGCGSEFNLMIVDGCVMHGDRLPYRGLHHKISGATQAEGVR